MVTLARGRNATPALGDLDGDSDRDLRPAGTGDGLWYFERR
ncbi:MAG: hypothetical protein RJQ04_20525 [Longimicrobiales bacterium]